MSFSTLLNIATGPCTDLHTISSYSGVVLLFKQLWGIGSSFSYSKVGKNYITSAAIFQEDSSAILTLCRLVNWPLLININPVISKIF